VVFPVPTDLPGFFESMHELAGAGEFLPIIDRRYHLDEIREAYEYARSGRKTGSLLLVFDAATQTGAPPPKAALEEEGLS
jgi:hypothetical protein